MISNKCLFKKNLTLPIYKLVRKNASLDFDDENVDKNLNFTNPKEASRLDEFKQKSDRIQEDLARKADEIVRRRKEEAKKLNKDFLLKMQIPGVKEDPEK